jgi:hypothetical protein
MENLTSQHFMNLARTIAEQLLGEWEVKPFPEDWSRRGAYLTEHVSQAMLAIGESQEYSERNKQRLTVSTDYPKDRHGHMSSARRPKISVSALKSGEQIARDIERRLLPKYLPILDKELATNRSWNEYESKTTLIAAHIANVVKVKRKPEETTVSFYHSPYNRVTKCLLPGTLTRSQSKLPANLGNSSWVRLAHMAESLSSSTVPTSATTSTRTSPKAATASVTDLFPAEKFGSTSTSTPTNMRS